MHATLYEWYGAKADDLAKAEAASRRALELAPGLADSHVDRGVALSLSARYDEAAVEFESAIRLNSNLLFRTAGDVRQEDFQSPVLLGQSLRMLGRDEEAKAATRESFRRIEHMLVLNPVDGRALSLGSLPITISCVTTRASRSC